MEDEGEKAERNSEDDQEFLKKIEQTMLSQVVLQGVPGVRKVFLRDAKSTFPDPTGHGDGFKDQNEWVLDTEGTNLLEVFSTLQHFISCCFEPDNLHLALSILCPNVISGKRPDYHLLPYKHVRQIS